MPGISQILQQFKQEWARQLDDRHLLAACQSVKLTWRNRVLPPAYTIKLFFLQILWGNTACDHVPHLADRRFSGEAYCKARAHLPLEVLQYLLTRCTSAMLAATRGDGLWRGHRLWLMDGTAFSMPDTPALQTRFGQAKGQRPGCGFPIAHGLALVHAASGLVTQLILGPLYTHDMSQAARLHLHLLQNDLLVADRGFSNYAHFALLLQHEVQGLMRAHQRLLVDFTPRRRHVQPNRKRTRQDRGLPTSRWVKRFGKQDQIVEWFRPKSRPDWMTAEQYQILPKSLLMRELRYEVKQKGFRVREVTLVTTLLDPGRYPADELARLYQKRWRIETDFAHLKTTLGMDVLKCKTVTGVEKEATMFVLVYNLVRMLMRETARRQGVEVERISFIDTLRWLMSAQSDSRLPNLIVNPLRPGRYEPRVRKRRPKSYPLMNRPRAELRKALETTTLRT
jgi:hypothetical protein